MILIIAHHYVVNSGILSLMSIDPLSNKSIFLYLFGMWGKIGINCFLLITGYFMCTKEATVKKFVMLIFEVMFYKLIISSIFIISGYEIFSIKNFIKTILPITNITDHFIGAFLIFYMFIPFLNILIKNMNEQKHRYLIILCLCVYSIWASIPFFTVSSNYVTWFSIIYIISAYIRLYPFSFGKIDMENYKFWGWISLTTIILSCASVIVMLVLFKKGIYFFVSDSHKPLAIVTSVAFFLFFKNLPMKYNKLINIIGASIFGVLLIHANSDTMRHWLWSSFLKNTEWFSTNNIYIHAIVSVISIFIVCAIIDQLRIRYIETPLFNKFYPLKKK